MYDGNKNYKRKSTLQAVPNSLIDYQVRSEEKEQAKTVSNVFFFLFSATLIGLEIFKFS